MIPLLVILGGYAVYLYLMTRKTHIDTDGFELLTVSEKVNKLKEETDKLKAVENLITDISMCDVSCQMVLHITWQTLDGETNTYELYLDGDNLASEKMQEIMMRESEELKAEVARCSLLLQNAENIVIRRG